MSPPCEGCIGESARNPSGGTLCTCQQLADWVLSCPGIDGLTVSGGEPFDQADAVSEVITLVRAVKPNLSLIVYTGKQYEELLARAEREPGIKKLLAQIQVLIDGPYLPHLDDGVPYRGSSNQRILILDESYRETANAYYTAASGRKIELISGRNGTWMIGVPSTDQANAWRHIKCNTL